MNNTCLMGPHFQPLAVTTNGFQWVNEGSPEASCMALHSSVWCGVAPARARRGMFAWLLTSSDPACVCLLTETQRRLGGHGCGVGAGV
jgi:hypothetical protein